MSVKMLTRVWEHSAHSGTGLLMMLAIADFADDDGNAYPAVGTLADKCRMTSRNVNHILAQLRESGELEVRQNEGPKGTNLYRIHLDPLKRVSPLKQPSPLKCASSTPEAHFLKPLKPTSDEPSVNHQEPSTRKRAKSDSTKFDSKAYLAAQGLPKSLIDDWFEVRKSKRLGYLTRLAMTTIEREAEKAGLSLVAAIEKCCIEGWGGFKAQWLQNKQSGAPQSPDMFAGGL